MNVSVKNDVKVLVIGDMMLDHYIYGICNRISPEAPVQIVEIKEEEYTLGGAGNVLKNLKSFNVNANVMSVVGNDDNAQIVNEHLNAMGVFNFTLINDEERCTTVKSRVLVSNHQLIRLDKEDIRPINNNIANQLIRLLEKNIKNYDIVLLSDYNKGLLSPTLLKHLFAICKAEGILTVIDPKGIDFSKYKGVNVIKPNKKEAIIASGINITNYESLRAACEKIKEITECDSVIITMSEDGMAFFNEDVLEIIPTKAIDVVDVTGAGDTVLASLGLAFASGYTLREACNFANHAAAVVVSKVGSATATLDEVEQKLLN
ncbi:MAG: D-glycero-beta-D-manno-heptose-7-phosphate kinase [Mucilaginibacter sp.]|uniref:D-glycero-beta-D-manno-heptose-7-phosphate kinase n=1 Tax=Mucilaginibacter sp. TaxID=1882438 RepID=UPI003265D997